MVGAGAIALDRVRLLRHLPLELHLGRVRRPRQHHLDRLTGRLRVPEVDQAGLRRAPLARERPAAGVAAHVRVGALVVDPRRHDPAVLVREIALLRLRQRHLVPGVAPVDRVAERVLGDERLLALHPVLEVRASEQDPDHQVDLHEVGRDQLAVDRHPGGDVPLAAPLRHVPVVVVDVVGVVEAAPVHEIGVAVADHVVPRQLPEEEVVQVVVHGDDALDVVEVPHQAHVVVGQRLVRDVRRAAAGHDRRRVRVPAAEQAVHLARVPGHLEGLQVEVPGERVQRPHDVGDRAVAVDVGVLGQLLLGLLQERRVRLLHHLLAEVHVRHAVVEDRVVEHVVGRLREVEREIAERRRLDAVGHVLVEARAGAVVVTADAADATGDEVRVPWVDPLHEDVEPAEDHRGRVALVHLLVREVDLGVDPEAADDPGDRVPRHLLDHHLLIGLRCLDGCHP